LVVVIAHRGVTWNAERGEGILDQGQLRGRAVFGKVAPEKAKLCGGRARFHLAHHFIEPRTARFLESVQIVYRDECEILGGRRFCAAQTARPNTER
jgi:hypothetical protein